MQKVKFTNSKAESKKTKFDIFEVIGYLPILIFAYYLILMITKLF